MFRYKDSISDCKANIDFDYIIDYFPNICLNLHFFKDI